MKIIGVSGVARSGKDSFSDCLVDELKSNGFTAERFALADELKKKMQDFLFREFSINILFSPPEQKELVRPLLVEFGKIKRKISNGRYWTSILEQNLKNKNGNLDFAIISDIRYKEYDFDEVDWIKSMGGKLVHVSRTLKDGSLVPPPNSEEEKNDPLMQEHADYKINWITDETLNVVKENVKLFFEEVITKWN